MRQGRVKRFGIFDIRFVGQGDTLVVDVTTFNDDLFDMSGNFHSGRCSGRTNTRASDDVLTYEANIEDPKPFTRPWRIRMPLYRNNGAQRTAA